LSLQEDSETIDLDELTFNSRADGKGDPSMQEPGVMPFSQPIDARPERPPNYVARATVLMVVLVPLCLLLGSSSLFAAWLILTGPPFRSEIPAWMSALMQLLRVLVAVIGLYVPLKAFFMALKVNSEFDAGNYGGAEKASKSAATYCRQSIIYVVLIVMIMGVDLLRYFFSSKD
jgi:hypothetical protein